jgi:hypothetical protein
LPPKCSISTPVKRSIEPKGAGDSSRTVRLVVGADVLDAKRSGRT